MFIERAEHDRADIVPMGLAGKMIAWSLLLVVLTFSCLTGLLTTYIMLFVALVATGYLLITGRQSPWVVDFVGATFAGGFLLLLLLFAITAQTPSDMLLSFNFTAFLFYVPFATLLGRSAGSGNSRHVAFLALVGVALGLLYCLFDVYVRGMTRAGTLETDPIRLANTALILGFLALMGCREATGWRRWALATGPIMALPVLLMTGSRTAMVAYVALAFTAALLLIRRRRAGLAIGGVLMALLITLGLTNIVDNSRLASLISSIEQIASSTEITDTSVQIRLELYKAGFKAFQQSPIIGHGWAHMMSSAQVFLPEAYKQYGSLPHLHNEVLNFAVFGGIVGILLYVALLLAPIVFAFRSARDSQRDFRVTASIVLCVAYITLGLADTMLSFELHTAMYVGFCAILLQYCRDRPSIPKH